MSLETKAKTFREINNKIIDKQQQLIDVAQDIEDEETRKVAVQKAWKDGCDLEDIKGFITLEEAQKIEKDLLLAVATAGKLNMKIAEANKEIDDSLNAFSDNEYLVNILEKIKKCFSQEPIGDKKHE
jgi:hypothetical protein